VVIGAAHRVFPAEGRPSAKTSGFDWTGVCLITHAPQDVAPDVLGVARHALSTSVAAVTQALPLVPREQVPGGELAGGEALDVKLADGTPARVKRFQIASAGDAGPPPDQHGVRR
jgi:hypothetical protein